MKTLLESGAILFAVALLVGGLGNPVSVQGQGGGNAGGGFTGGVGNTGGGGNVGGGNSGFPATGVGNQATANQGGQAAQPDVGATADLNIGQTIVEFEDLSNQPFVGLTLADVEANGFVGANRLVAPGSQIGAGGQVAGRGTQNRNAGGLGGFGIGGFGQGSQNVVEIPRLSVRGRLVNRMDVQRPDGAEIIERFASRIGRLPAVRNLTASGLSVQVENGTATVTGTASSPRQVQLLIRQLQLEPGIYKVQDKTAVAEGT